MDMMDVFRRVKSILAEKGWHSYVCCNSRGILNGKEQQFVWQFINYKRPSVVLMETDGLYWNGISEEAINVLAKFVTDLPYGRDVFRACASRFLSLDCTGYPLTLVTEQEVQKLINQSGEIISSVRMSI